jgi:hypothetical protein
VEDMPVEFQTGDVVGFSLSAGIKAVVKRNTTNIS